MGSGGEVDDIKLDNLPMSEQSFSGRGTSAMWLKAGQPTQRARFDIVFNIQSGWMERRNVFWDFAAAGVSSPCSSSSNRMAGVVVIVIVVVIA
jgi:hypothetical protein